MRKTTALICALLLTVMMLPLMTFAMSAEQKATYTLTLNYIYPDGTVAAEPYVGTYEEGAEYSVTPPAIDGYLPPYSVYTGTMSAEDTTIDVVYSATSITYYGEEVDLTNAAVGDAFYYTVSVTEFGGIYSGHWLSGYDEDFIEVYDPDNNQANFSVTWSGGIQSIVQAQIDADAQWSDVPYVHCNPLYVGGSGQFPFGNVGESYANFGLAIMSLSYDGFQAGGGLVRLRYKIKAIPAMEDCMQDEKGYYLPMDLWCMESSYYAPEQQYDTSDHDVTLVDGKLYFYELPTAPTIESQGVELRNRPTDDSRADIRFTFKVTFNDSYVTYGGIDYGPTTEYYHIDSFYTVLTTSSASVTVPGRNIYSMANDSFTFTAVIRNITGNNFDSEITAVAYLKYGDNCINTEPVTASVNSLQG